MARIDCLLDTKPMAHEMTSISNHIKGTTAAVVAMQTAVVLAEQKAADQVCSNVNKGFYTMMRSQISQKIASLQSQVDSYLMQLNAQRKQLLAIRTRMERDYNMICNRYMRLFNGLNQNLRQRVFELDKPTIDFAVREVERVSNRTKYLTATVPVAQVESLADSQKILASNIKNRGAKVIASMSAFLSASLQQKKLTDKVLLTHNHAQTESLAIPVLISECNFDKFDTKNLDIFICESLLSAPAQSAVRNTLNQQLESLQWEKQTQNDKEIKSEFSKLIAASTAPDRVKELAQKLFANNPFQIIKNQ